MAAAAQGDDPGQVVGIAPVGQWRLVMRFKSSGLAAPGASIPVSGEDRHPDGSPSAAVQAVVAPAH